VLRVSFLTPPPLPQLMPLKTATKSWFMLGASSSAVTLPAQARYSVSGSHWLLTHLPPLHPASSSAGGMKNNGDSCQRHMSADYPQACQSVATLGLSWLPQTTYSCFSIQPQRSAQYPKAGQWHSTWQPSQCLSGLQHRYAGRGALRDWAPAFNMLLHFSH
jgi:hypothetical protein